MKILFILPIVLMAACSGGNEEKRIQDIKESRSIDSAAKNEVQISLFDTAGLWKAPVKVIRAWFVNEANTNRKNISITFSNVSDKTIEGIKFKWYGTDVFGEPADMGLIKGFGGGVDDRQLSSGKSRTSTWPISSVRGKKIVLAWPHEIVFSDGSKWELNK